MPVETYSSADLNNMLFEQLAKETLEKKAVDAVNEFTRVRMDEDGFYRRIMPPLTISNDELDREVDTDKPVMIVNKPFVYAEFMNQLAAAGIVIDREPSIIVKDKAKDAPVAVIMNGDDILYMAEPFKSTSLRYPRGLTL